MTNHIVLLLENHVVKVCENHFSYQDAICRAQQLNFKCYEPSKNELWNGTEIIFEATDYPYLGVLMVRWENNIF